MMIGYREIGLILRIAADRHRIIDPGSSVELRAAAEVCKMLDAYWPKGIEVDSIDDWLLGLLRRVEKGRSTRTFCGDVACPGMRNCDDPDCALARGNDQLGAGCEVASDERDDGSNGAL